MNCVDNRQVCVSGACVKPTCPKGVPEKSLTCPGSATYKVVATDTTYGTNCSECECAITCGYGYHKDETTCTCEPNPITCSQDSDCRNRVPSCIEAYNAAASANQTAYLPGILENCAFCGKDGLCHKTPLDAEYCNKNDMVLAEKCGTCGHRTREAIKCESNHWVYSEWSECKETPRETKPCTASGTECGGYQYRGGTCNDEGTAWIYNSGYSYEECQYTAPTCPEGTYTEAEKNKDKYNTYSPAATLCTGEVCYVKYKPKCSDEGLFDTCANACEGNKKVTCTAVNYYGKTCYKKTKTSCSAGYNCSGNNNCVASGCSGAIPSGKYCQITDYGSGSGECNTTENYFTNMTGEYADLGQINQLDIEGLGTVYFSSNNIKGWFNTNNWCKAIGKNLLREEDIPDKYTLMRQIADINGGSYSYFDSDVPFACKGYSYCYKCGSKPSAGSANVRNHYSTGDRAVCK